MWTITTSPAVWWHCMLESSADARRARPGDDMKFWISVLALVMATFAFDAEAARRLGGGSSVGRQSSNVTQREAQRGAQPAAPNQNQAQPANAAPPVQQGPRWGGMLGGLAAGLGLAWLAHSLGLDPALGQFILIFLVVLLAMTLIGWA